MPILISQQLDSDFSDPIGLLTDCHRRIENFLKAVHIVAVQCAGKELVDEQGTILQSSLRYFSEAAPKHTLDEEESLFPRMLAHGDTRRILELLNPLEADHRELQEHHKRIDELGRKWLANDFLAENELTHLLTLLSKANAIYTAHIAKEEGEVFPLARHLLGTPEMQDLGKEMAARRGLVIQISRD